MNRPSEWSGPPQWLFVLELGYAATLVLLAVVYAHCSGFRNLIPDPAGPVPLGVPWWGALGGVTISLTGIFRNRRRWDTSYHAWHISRPVLGAIVGAVGYLIFIAVLRSTGAEIGPNNETGRATFYLVAFLVGYREAIFRDLLKRAADVLFTSGNGDKPTDPDRLTQ